MPPAPALEPKELERVAEVLRGTAEAVQRAVDAVPLEQRGEVIGMGADGTDTKRVDKVAEDTALQHITKAGLKFGIVSEEVGRLAGESPWTLVIDPMDGTTNAVRGLPLHCISIALGHGTTDQLAYGLIRNLATGDVYEAFQGQGATLNGRPLKVRKLVAREKPTISVVLGKKADDFSMTIAGTWANVRSFGSAALETAFVGAGALDAYYHGYGSLRVTDIAAGVLVVREAGGEVYDGTFKRLVMELDLAQRTTVLACGDRTFAERAGAVRRR